MFRMFHNCRVRTQHADHLLLDTPTLQLLMPTREKETSARLFLAGSTSGEWAIDAPRHCVEHFWNLLTG